MSRYSNYTSRYGDRDYSSSSYLSGSGSRYSSTRDRERTSTYTPRTYEPYSSTTSPYTSYASKYGTSDYTSKYRDRSADKTDKLNDKMEDLTLSAPIVKDEIEELNYDEPKTPVDEVDDALPREVLQESQIEEFAEAEKPTEEVEVKLTLAAESEPEDDDEYVEEEEEEKVEEPLAPAAQIRDFAASPPAAKVFEVPSAAVDENRTPSPTVLNAKKLGGIPWPPKNQGAEVKNAKEDSDNLPKKGVSDLIARFNSGKVDNEGKKTETSYKSEYGAANNVGKVSTHNFA